MATEEESTSPIVLHIFSEYIQGSKRISSLDIGSGTLLPIPQEDSWYMEYPGVTKYDDQSMVAKLREGSVFSAFITTFITWLENTDIENAPQEISGETNEKMHNFLERLFRSDQAIFTSSLVPSGEIQADPEIMYEYSINLELLIKDKDVMERLRHYRKMAIERGYVIKEK